MNPSELKQIINQNADHCVMCGMCLPHCPTYRIYQSEAESPRGRIALMNALAQERIKVTNKTLKHLEHCLGCMACEVVCPSKVPFGLLQQESRILYKKNIKSPLPVKQLLKLLLKPDGLKKLATPAVLTSRLGIASIIATLSNFSGYKSVSRFFSLLPFANNITLGAYYPATGQACGNIAIFTGCMGNLFDSETVLSSIHLLTRLGYNVHIPKNQSCCGALHQQKGDMKSPIKLAEINRETFNKLNVSHIIFFATACGIQLRDNHALDNSTDILDFLLHTQPDSRLEFRHLQHPVLIHESCAIRYKSKLPGLTNKVLSLIPGIQFHNFSKDNLLCCGAGGSHQVAFPEQADDLMSLKLTEIKTIMPKYLISDNIGCSIHYKNHLKQNGIDIEVLHPVTLLARQLV